MNKICESQLSFLYIVPISEGRGIWPFPAQLRENLFQNSVRVKGLYSTKAFKGSYIFATSNASEHGVGKKVITNVLGIFNFEKPKTFQLNGTMVTAPINSIPTDMKFTVTNEKFKRETGFEGWMWVEIQGCAKKNVE